VVKGEAMNRWGHTPIENIAYALLKISETLERIENKMPTPEGIITTSDIYVTEATVEVEEEKIPWEEVKKDLGIENDLPELS
jgi:hypothetical protein